MDWKTKIGSRKFLLATAAFLISVGTGISGLALGNTSLTATGAIMAVVGTGIYQAAEAYVDGKSAGSAQTINQIVTTKQVTATTSDKATVQAAFAPESPEVKEA